MQQLYRKKFKFSKLTFYQKKKKDNIFNNNPLVKTFRAIVATSPQHCKSILHFHHTVYLNA